MKVFVAALAAETNTFVSTPTGMAAFEELGIRRGPGGDADPAAIGLMLDAIRDVLSAGGHVMAEGLCAAAQPLGPTTGRVYEALRDELLRDLAAAMPVEAVHLILHGAMVADRCDDCEGDVIARVRAAVGPDVRIGVTLDLHCHFTELMRREADVLVCFKEYPHTDTAARAAETCRLTVDAALGRIRPATGVHDCRMTGLWHTTREPMAGFVRRMRALEGCDGVLSVSFGHGFPWGDVAEAGAKVWVVADGDQAKADALAAELGRELWDMRAAGVPPGVPVDAALDRLRPGGSGPAVLADMADNPGGGAPGDSTFVLRRLLERGIGDVALGCVWDPGAAALCRNAGPGATFDLRMGGKTGPASGDPLDARVTVRAVLDDHWQSAFGSRVAFGPSAWVSAPGDVDVVLVSHRQQVLDARAFTGLGIDVAAKRGVVVKSAQHFHAAFAPFAREVVYVAGPGALSHDFAALPYRKRSPNYWPRAADPFAEPGP